MAGEFRNLTDWEKQVCIENGIDPEGKTVVLSNDTGLWLIHHKTRDEIHIRFGDARLRRNKEEHRNGH